MGNQMTKIDLKQACERLPELVEEAVAGNDVLITKDQKSLVRLVPAPEPPPQISPMDAADKLKAWHEVYAGFSDDEIAELEAMVLDRNRFLRGKR